MAAAVAATVERHGIKESSKLEVVENKMSFHGNVSTHRDCGNILP